MLLIEKELPLTMQKENLTRCFSLQVNIDYQEFNVSAKERAYFQENMRRKDKLKDNEKVQGRSLVVQRRY